MLEKERQKGTLASLRENRACMKKYTVKKKSKKSL